MKPHPVDSLVWAVDAPPVDFRPEWRWIKTTPSPDPRFTTPFEYAEKTLLFQVADLRRSAESGRPWPASMATREVGLRCGFPTQPTWRTLGAVLELGRLYE